MFHLAVLPEGLRIPEYVAILDHPISTFPPHRTSSLLCRRQGVS
jgi:hypothetical protein